LIFAIHIVIKNKSDLGDFGVLVKGIFHKIADLANPKIFFAPFPSVSYHLGIAIRVFGK
jgi:hypothetical protein